MTAGRARKRLTLATTVGVLAAGVLAGSAAWVAAPAAAAVRRAKAVPAVVAITHDWEAFFRGSTPASEKIALVQDGPAFARVIRAQAGSALARSTTAKVSRVRLETRTSAAVVYTILLGGQPALRNVKGTSLFLQHRWKVSAKSFCALLSLEQVKVPVCR